MMNEMLRAALEYATVRNWYVLPLYSVREVTPTQMNCTCAKADRCPARGKHPRIQNWPAEASRDPNVIRKWNWVGSNVGVLTGTASALVVVDIDPRNGGDPALATLTAQLGPLTDTLTVVTGGAGTHLYYRYPSTGAVPSRALTPGIDIKSDAAFVVAPPSRHQSGRAYRWQVVTTQEAPL